MRSPDDPALEAWAEHVAAGRWGITARARRLAGDRDLTFLLAGAGGERILKAPPPGEDRALLACQDRVLDRLAAAGTPFVFPRPIPALDGDLRPEVPGPDGRPRPVRLLEHVAGVPMAEARPWTPGLLEEVGRLVGTVDRTLEGFDDPAAHRELDWDLARGEAVVRGHLDLFEGPSRRRLESVLALVETRAHPLLDILPRGVIHGDGNDHNVLVAPRDDPRDPFRIRGLLDFGDLVHSWRVGEVAVAGAYAMMGRRDPLDALARVAAGYHAVHPLTEAEIEVLHPLALLRAAVSVTMAARRRRADPSAGDYDFVSEEPAWALLEWAGAASPALAHYVLRDACGLPACPAGERVASWLARHPEAPGPVLEPDPGACTRITFDLSVGGAAADPSTPPVTAEPVSDAERWRRTLFGRMEAAGARVGVGRWDEARAWYTTAAYHTPGDEGPVPRTVHVGVDLFVAPGTPVRAALAGTVAAVRDNARPLDYGPTVVVRHEPEPGLVFHTLHGHLARDGLDALRPGDRVARGDVIGRVGDVHENGGWAPHLHLQILADTLGLEGDFPGVCRPDRRGVWRSISPDPNLLLRLPEGVRAPPSPPAADLLDRRARRLGPNLSVAYRTPIHVVRGWMQHLLDADGRPFLDCVNNVAHVGHGHPRVVAAMAHQAAVLNTNTRYLHRAVLDYADRLTGLLPAPLRVCWLVCSGSEANELALRLARAHTGRRDVVVLEGAYHGNTGTLVAMSPYKFRGPGGSGREPWVHTALLPDPYRGRHRGADAASAYAADVARALGDAAHRRPGPTAGEATRPGAAAFFAESLPGCGGQIEPPPGYLARAFRAAREAGAVCVADEVQTGLGRMGSHWWGFETQDAVPDIVTLGKPLGNGHPLAAVVTTPAIARSFDTGMEYFNTFGGNPVSCAAGAAVLDVMEDEGLRERARDVGAYLKRGLEELGRRHPLVGDVRGRGLFLGIELVRDRDARTPAGRAAAWVVERARHLGVLLSTDGPAHDVLKIKPPLAFTRTDADLLVEVLDRVLGEDALREG